MERRYIGEKYYKYKGNDTLVYRINKIDSDKLYAYNVENPKDKVILNNHLIIKKYYKLRPKVYVNIVSVSVGDCNDVVVTIHKENELSKQEPYAICRQMIFDVFSEEINRTDIARLAGTSVSIDTCPDNVDYMSLLACDSYNKVNTIALYRDDTIDVLTSLIDTKEYDDILKAIYDKSYNMVEPNGRPWCGFNKSLYDLLINTGFKIDLMRAMGILTVDFDIEINNNKISDSNLDTIEVLIRETMVDHIIVKYDSTMNLNDIQVKYILVSDNSNNLYVINYTSGGIKDRSDEELFKQIRSNMRQMNSINKIIN